MSNLSITRDSISLMIYESLRTVWAVESNYHPSQVLGDDV